LRIADCGLRILASDARALKSAIRNPGLLILIALTTVGRDMQRVRA